MTEILAHLFYYFFFKAPWQLSQDILSSEINPTIREEDIVRFSKEEILEVYQQTES